MDKINEFIDFLRGTSVVEYNLNYTTIVSLENAQGKKGAFFTCGLGEKKSTRCSGVDIKTKKYFYVDLDIRSIHYDNTGTVLSQEELDAKIREVMALLSNTNFSDYCAMVATGNGLHIYYSGEERHFDKDIYSMGVDCIYDILDKRFKEIGLYCDRACKDINRLSRLPGGINGRYKEGKDKNGVDIIKRNLGDIAVNLIYFEKKNSKFFENIEAYAEVKKKNKIIEHEKISGTNKKERGPTMINNIPANKIAESIWKVKTGSEDSDGCVPLKESHKNMGAYRYKKNNTIINTGSSLIKNKTIKSFTSYELVYYELMGENEQKTLDYFKENYGIETQKKGGKREEIQIPKREYKRIGYLYGCDVFKQFVCMMSGELVFVVSEYNAGKTTFAMDMIQTNSRLGKKCFYINLEFAIETVWQNRWLFINGKDKSHLTDLNPLTENEQRSLDKYVQENLSKFTYHNDPNGMELEDLIELIIKKNEEGFGLFVLDSFSKIKGNLDSKIAHSSQNKVMERMQELCQGIGVVCVILHHTNKAGVFEGTQKIPDLSNVFIIMSKEEDSMGERTTTFELSKDKFVTKIVIETKYIDHKYVLVGKPEEKPKPF